MPEHVPTAENILFSLRNTDVTYMVCLTFVDQV